MCVCVCVRVCVCVCVWTIMASIVYYNYVYASVIVLLLLLLRNSWTTPIIIIIDPAVFKRGCILRCQLFAGSIFTAAHITIPIHTSNNSSNTSNSNSNTNNTNTNNSFSNTNNTNTNTSNRYATPLLYELAVFVVPCTMPHSQRPSCAPSGCPPYCFSCHSPCTAGVLALTSRGAIAVESACLCACQCWCGFDSCGAVSCGLLIMEEMGWRRGGFYLLLLSFPLIYCILGVHFVSYRIANTVL